MTDRHDEDHETREHPAARPAPGGEGVRIIGAEEAQAALESGAVGRRIPDREPRFGDVPARPEVPASPGLSFPTSDLESDLEPAVGADFETDLAPAEDLGATPAEEPTAEHPDLLDEVARATAVEPDEAPDLSAGEAVATPAAPEGLPHWSEPATGEVPVILGADDDTESTGENPIGPRFRTGTGDWEDDEYEAFQVLAATEDDEDLAAGLAARALPPDDDDVAFDREVAARRVRTVGADRERGARPVRPVPAREDREGGDRPDMLVRVVTGLGMAALALLCLNAGTDATMVLATAIVAACTFELFSALHTRGFRPAAVIGLLGALTIVPLAYHRGEFAFPFTFAIITIFTLLWFVFEVVHTRPMVNVAVTIGGFMYTGGLGAFAGLLLTSANGVGLVLGVALPVIAYDVFGYFVGSQFGKSRLAPTISPNKTIEGLIGGMTGAIIVSVLIVKQIHPWGSLGHAFALGLTVAVMAPLGDLAESMLKRDLGIKDFGTLLPGHGGVLDRFDALLFCLPAVYFLARALKIG
ncbi:MAG: phosphatidate cytidylyltransferase [Acidimicrobiia bacterium]